MAYVPANLQLLKGTGPNGTQLWTLKGVDAIATVRGAGFISDALIRGFRIGDQLIYSDTATPLTSLATVTVVASTGATLVA
jgi:hypothetical protein